MMILPPAAAIVKPAVVVLFDSAAPRPVKARPFGRLPQRGRKLPVGPSAADLDAYRAMTPCPAAAPTDREWADHIERATMTAAEYRAFRAELAAAEADRYLAAEVAELAELRMAEADMDRAAGEAEYLRFAALGHLPC